MTEDKRTIGTDAAAGDSLTIAQLAAELGTHTTTVLRWIRKGLPSPSGRKRVCLVGSRCRRSWTVSRAAYAAFVDALSLNASAMPLRSPTERHRGSDKAMAALKSEFGI